jgi:2-amino-4-hydroxy-6-hydroxymethyldihydropteridine diphosphokinase
MKVYLSIGSNINNRSEYLLQSIRFIGNEAGQIAAKSDVYKTESWGYKDFEYLNMCIEIDTELDPFALLALIEKFEKKAGRLFKTNKNKYLEYKAREIDIDILFYEQIIMQTPILDIPHPRMHRRMFVLKPLNQIAPDFIHPVFKESIRTLSLKCKDKATVEMYRSDFIPN